MVVSVSFECLRFAEIGARDWSEMLALRSRVFVVEQRCVYLDPDGLDVGAHHVFGWTADVGRERRLVCGARILGPGVSYVEPSFHTMR